MIERLFQILAAIGSEGFIWIVAGVVFVLFVLGHFHKLPRSTCAALMTSLGILGTFCGIFVAIYPLEFNPGEVDKDAKMLIGGMRVAFVTSLIGIFAAIVSRFIWEIRKTKILPPPPDQNIVRLLDAIKNAIAGDGDSSMVAQMQELRNENREGFKKLDGVSEKIDSVSEETRNALIARLESVKSAIAGDGDLSVTAQMQKLHDENRERFEKIDSMSEEARKMLIDRLESVKNAIAGDSDLSVVAQMDKLRDENRGEFKKLDGLTEEMRNALVDRLESVKSAIAGDDDSSMTAQMDKLRNENREGFKKLDGLTEEIRNALVKNIAELIAKIQEEIANKLVKSVVDLTEEIRRAFSDHLGKAFEDFNAAAQAIKKWQEDHRQHVEQLTEAFEKSAQGIERIRADCESIPKTMEDLRAMVEAANVQQKELAEHLRVFANLKTEAEKSFPTIKSHLDKIGADLASSAESFDGLGEKIQTAFQLAEKATKRVAEQHAENVEKMASNMREKMEKAQRDASAGVQESVNKLMQQLTAEISHLTKEWGGNLLSIAEQCAKTIRRVREQTDQ